MAKEQLLKYINNLVALPSNIEAIIADAFKEEKHSKRTLLEKQNTVCSKLYFVEKGLARLFYQKEGKDITGWFASEGNFITCNDSFFQKKTSYLNLELLEDSILYSIDYNALDNLFQYKEMETFGRLLTYYLLSELSERIYSTMFQPAEKRYQLLMVRYPEVALRAPLGDIASYLGISQETLSRIRSQQSHKSKAKQGVYNS
ncbi:MULTISPECIES: Crp/Fnr family transcriptional regulator [Chitinophagaceae]